jgi:hypothetical protein
MNFTQNLQAAIDSGGPFRASHHRQKRIAFESRRFPEWGILDTHKKKKEKICLTHLGPRAG